MKLSISINRSSIFDETIYELQKERLSKKPVPYVRVVKSMMHLLSRTRPEMPPPVRKASRRRASSTNLKAPVSSKR